MSEQNTSSPADFNPVHPTYPLALPYAFDTRLQGRSFLRVVTAVDSALIACSFLVLLVSNDVETRFWSPIILIILAFVCLAGSLWIFRAAGGAVGTVGKAQVTIEPDHLMGITARSHQGTFPTSEFSGLLITKIGINGNVGILRIIHRIANMSIVIKVDRYDLVKNDAIFLAQNLSLPLKEQKG